MIYRNVFLCKISSAIILLFSSCSEFSPTSLDEKLDTAIDLKRMNTRLSCHLARERAISMQFEGGMNGFQNKSTKFTLEVISDNSELVLISISQGKGSAYVLNCYQINKFEKKPHDQATKSITIGYNADKFIASVKHRKVIVENENSDMYHQLSRLDSELLLIPPVSIQEPASLDLKIATVWYSRYGQKFALDLDTKSTTFFLAYSTTLFEKSG